ncbi:hypothetical protein QFX18_15175 [Saccharophagus degradans]|uniref:hypothetical protein n=1 Tax=Saccharophagus degradans TaxID=86304 RepID=UPI002477EB22|nr:hypothetical protein [Saccharophagus degradans]WGO97377.1 hypothetical protein QFX18_15175 [Saccharophagus degradans]
MLKKHTPVLLLMALTACSDTGTAPQETAEAVITTSMNAEGDSATNTLILQQPEVQQVIDCIAGHLDSQGWTSAQHDEFMKITNGGNPKNLPANMSEEETMAKIGPVFAATGECM